jgi:copper chaperone
MKLAIEGMHCQGCVTRVRKALEKVEGVSVNQVDVGSAEVSADASRETAILDAVRKLGFQPQKAE